MIQLLNRDEIELSKYNNCVENSSQNVIYALSWYLDIVADNWCVLVVDDYKAVMPLPIREKGFINYVYPPFWLLELGFFTTDDNISLKDFRPALQQHFKFVETRLNTSNFLPEKNDNLIYKTFQEIQLQSYDLVKELYRKDRLKDLKKAKKNDLVERWNDNPENLITLFKNNVGLRTKNIKENDYRNLAKLIKTCLKNKTGDLLSVYDKNNSLVAAAFFLKHQDKVTILCSSTNFKNRNNGANTYLIDRAMYNYSPHYNVFNFGGSSLPSVRKYFLSFGAIDVNYQLFKMNNLPFFLKLFKR